MNPSPGSTNPTRTAVVTGASSGIGRAMALALGSRGYACVLLGRSQESLQATANLLAAPASLITADLSDATSTAEAATRLASQGKVDLLVHSAGAYEMAPVEGTNPAVFDRILAVNLRAPFLLTRALLPNLAEARGQIVFINSSAALRPGPQVGAYAASKAGLKAFADSLRDEVNPKGIRVVSIFPGRTASPMQAAIFEKEGRAYHPERLMQPEDVVAAVLASLDLPRTAELTDLQIRPMMKG